MTVKSRFFFFFLAKWKIFNKVGLRAVAGNNARSRVCESPQFATWGIRFNFSHFVVLGRISMLECYNQEVRYADRC